MATHNKDDLHGTELLEPELSALANGESQLDDKHAGEVADARSDGDVGSTLEPDRGARIDRIDDVLGVLDHVCNAESGRNDGEHERNDQNDTPVQGTSCRADNVDLEDQRCFEADQQEKSEDHA